MHAYIQCDFESSRRITVLLKRRGSMRNSLRGARFPSAYVSPHQENAAMQNESHNCDTRPRQRRPTRCFRALAWICRRLLAVVEELSQTLRLTMLLNIVPAYACHPPEPHKPTVHQLPIGYPENPALANFFPR